MANFLSNGDAGIAIVVIDGESRFMHVNLNQHGITAEDVMQMTDEEAFKRFNIAEVEDVEVNDAVRLFKEGVGADQFVKVSDSYFHVEVDDISIPKDLFVKMIEALDVDDVEMYNSLLLFWKWCGMCDNPKARQGLFKFLSTSGFRITDTGLVQTYRNVHDVHTVLGGVIYENLFTFLRESWTKVRDTWKEAPSKFYVNVTNGTEYSLQRNSVADFELNEVILGTLADVYEEAKTNTVFTDNYTKTMTIKMYEPVIKDRSDCDFNHSNECSHGLHVGTTNYVTKSWLGDVGIIVLINPKDIVSVPDYDSEKMRVSKYLPIDFIDYNKYGRIIERDYSLINDTYSNTSIEDLDEQLSKITVTEIGSYRIVPTDIPMTVYDQLRSDLKEINDSLKGRTVIL